MTELNENLDFETAYADLRDVVRQMEDPKNKIEDTIALYEKACRLVLHCRRKLDEARMEISDVNERIRQLRDSGAKLFED